MGKTIFKTVAKGVTTDGRLEVEQTNQRTKLSNVLITACLGTPADPCSQGLHGLKGRSVST